MKNIFDGLTPVFSQFSNSITLSRFVASLPFFVHASRIRFQRLKRSNASRDYDLTAEGETRTDVRVRGR